MANIKTVTEEITPLEIDLQTSVTGGEYEDLVKILQKIIDKLDELTSEVNNIKDALGG